MSDQLYNNTIIVYDQKTNGIICSANSDSHGAAIALGICNAKFVAMDQNLNPNCAKVNYDDINIHYRINRNRHRSQHHIETLASEFVTEEWINCRELALQKSQVLARWEFSVRQQLSRMNDFFDQSSVMSFLTTQLSLCDPNKDYYTKPIMEWGEIQEISPGTAYQELKIRQEGHGVVYLRRHALYLKYARKISMAKTIDDVRWQATLAREALGGMVI